MHREDALATSSRKRNGESNVRRVTFFHLPKLRRSVVHNAGRMQMHALLLAYTWL